jgi:preprotein translocase subunit SecB
MPISPLPLEVEGYYVRALHLDSNDDYDGNQPSVGEIEVDFRVFPHPEDSFRFQVAMLIDIDGEPPSLNEPYSLHIDLYAFFRFKAETAEEVVNRMIFSNAIPILYGIARGCVGQATGTAFHGPLMLPPYNFVELFNRKAAEIEKRQVSGVTSTPSDAEPAALQD